MPEIVVPRIVITAKHLPESIRVDWRCLVCDHPISGRTEEAISIGMHAHASYIAHTVDAAVDDHFADLRMDRLLAD